MINCTDMFPIIKLNKTLRVHVFIAFIILIFAYSVSLADDSQQALNLETLLREALQNNPEILAAKRSAEAANARIWQAGSLNDPMLEFEYDKIAADRMLTGDPMKTAAVSQDIPFPTKLYLRAKIASKLAKMEYENYKAKERAIIAQVKSAYAQLALVYKSMDIAKENKGILEQFSSSATTRYSSGQGTQADALKAQIELAKIDNQLILLEQQRLSAQARLNVLINRDPKEELGIPAPEGPVSFTRPLEEFYTLARRDSPELKAYRYAIEKGRAAYTLSVNEFLPDFTLKYKEMARKGALEKNEWAGMVGVTIPLWFFQKQAFGVKEMKSELEMVEAEYRQKENMVLFDVRDSYARVEANKKLVELYETSFLPQAEQTVNAALKAYQSEKTDFLTLLDSQRMLIEFKLDHYKAILELRLALADLERAVGVDLK